MTESTIKMHPSWLEPLRPQFDLPYMQTLKTFLQEERRAGKQIFPPGPQIFNSFNTTPLDAVRVVILGQDPYHGPGQAHGLSFSVPPGVRIPPSLLNMFKEIERDLGIPIPAHGCLQAWAERGVLLLNATLTVESGQAGSHQGKGWEPFTDEVIRVLNQEREGLVFMLWGSYAQKKGRIIDARRHRVLQSPHPSPLSAHRGFMGNGHFSQANQYLLSRGAAPVDWSLPAR